MVLARVFVVADANQRPLEQLHDRGKHLLARQTRTPQVRGGARADARQAAANTEQRSNFVSSRTAATAGDSDTACVRARRARWPGGGRGIWTDPHVGPRGRNRERLDSLEYLRVGDRASVRLDVTHARLAADAADAGQHAIVDVMQLRDRRGRDGIDLGRFRDPAADETERVRDASLVARDVPPRRRKRRRQSCTRTRGIHEHADSKLGTRVRTDD